jgi:hypothetical protein
MRDKIIQLVWDLTMAADAPPELADSHTMETVVKHYVTGNNISQVGSRSIQGLQCSRCTVTVPDDCSPDLSRGCHTVLL